MPNTLKKCKNYLQFLTPLDQINEINHAIQDMLPHKNIDDNINKKYSIIRQLNIIKKQLLIRIMRTVNTNASNENSFKYSILWSLHYFDILRNPQKISKLMSLENIYHFTHNTPKEFEIDNANISLTVFNEDERIIY